MSEVTDALRALQAGERTIEDVEQMFRSRNWPRKPPGPKNATEAFAREQTDYDEADGSFAEVGQAFFMGVIDADAYERLAAAAHEAMSAPPAPAPDSEPDKEADTGEDNPDPDKESAQVSEGAPKDTTEDES